MYRKPIIFSNAQIKQEAGRPMSFS